jgi:uncharacterized protein (DUF433 family)
VSTITITHIEIDEKGVAWIADTNTKVLEVVQDKLAYGWSPEEIHFQHPHLSLAKIYAALTYYYDHQGDLDAEIDRRRQQAREVAERISDPALREKLRSLRDKR